MSLAGKRGKSCDAFILIAIALIFISFPAIAGELLPLQGNADLSGTPISSGGLVVEIWDGPDVAGSNLIYNSTDNFTGTGNISSGQFDIVLGSVGDELNLEYGKTYYMDLYIAGNDMNFSGKERQVFMSSVGMINSSFLNASDDYNFKSLLIENKTTPIDNYYLNISDGETTKFIIDPDGNVGIGTTNPSYKLDVYGSVNATSFLMNDTSCSNGLVTDDNGLIYCSATASSFDDVSINTTHSEDNSSLWANLTDISSVFSNYFAFTGLASELTNNLGWFAFGDYEIVEKNDTLLNDTYLRIGIDEFNDVSVNATHSEDNSTVWGEIVTFVSSAALNLSYALIDGNNIFSGQNNFTGNVVVSANLSAESYGRSVCSPGYVLVPADGKFMKHDFCMMKYEAKKNISADGDLVVSSPGNKPWVSLSWYDSKSMCHHADAHLCTNGEWMATARNIEAQAENWASGVVGTGCMYGGHMDNLPGAAMNASIDDGEGYWDDSLSPPANYTDGSTSCPFVTTGSDDSYIETRRTHYLSNGEVIWDLSGNVWEWVDEQCTAGDVWDATAAWVEWDAAALADLETYLAGPSGSYTDDQGAGRFYGCTADANAFLRGGGWYHGPNAGLFALHLTYAPSDTGTTIGFRCCQ